MVSVPTINSVDRPRSHGFAAQIDDLLVRTVNFGQQQIRVQSARAQAQQVNTSENPEEFISDVGRTFAVSDATGGEGLLLRHRRQRGDSDSIRYWDSRGVRIERPQAGGVAAMTLLEDTESIYTGGANAAPLVAFGSSLFVGNGTDVTRIDTPAGTPSTGSEAVGAGAVVGLAKLGSVLYAAGTSAMRQRVAGTWGATSATLAATGIWSALDRLFVAVGGELHEWPDVSSATTNTLYTLPSGASWVGVVDGPEAVYAAASNGFVYAFAPDETGALQLLGQTLFQAETPTCVGSSQGLVFVGTEQAGTGRLWVMTSNAGELSGTVVREWQTGVPQAIAADRESVYTVVYDGNSVHSSWRYDVVTGGLHRWWDYGLASTYESSGLAILGSDVYAAFDGTAVEVWRVADTVVSEGYLISPLADFFTTENKTWVGATLDVGAVPSGTRVELYYTTKVAAMTNPETGDWRIAGSASSPTDLANISIAGVEARQLAGMVRLYANAGGTEAPELESFSFRGLLASTDVLVELPVSVSDWIEQPYKRPVRVPGLGEAVYQALRSRERANVYVELFRPGERIRGQVETVDTPVPQLSPRGSSLLVSMVTIRGRRVGASGASEVTGPLGSFVLGSLPLGGSV